MSRRRSSAEPSSMDLLLDTMCNTFGGIVFIALLLSIISGMSGRKDDDVPPDSGTNGMPHQVIDDIESQIAAYSNEIARMEGMTNSLPSMISSNELALINALVTEGVIETNLAIATSNESALGSVMITLSNSIADINRKIDDITRLNEINKTSSTLQLRMPKLHSAYGRRNVFVAISDGKFYAITQVPKFRNTFNQAYDTEDIDLESGAGKDVIELRPAAGHRITDATLENGKLGMALRHFEPDSHVINFTVNTNSFREFNMVKKRFIERGFKYNWHVFDGVVEIVLTSVEPLAQ